MSPTSRTGNHIHMRPVVRPVPRPASGSRDAFTW